MRARDRIIAEKFGVLERCKAFEADLLKLKDIVPDKLDDGIPFDLSGFLSGIYQVIIVPQYDIRADRPDYWGARKRLRERVTALAKKYELHRTDDPVEDHGAHFYFVFRCGKTWYTEHHTMERRDIHGRAAHQASDLYSNGRG